MSLAFVVVYDYNFNNHFLFSYVFNEIAKKIVLQKLVVEAFQLSICFKSIFQNEFYSIMLSENPILYHYILFSL